MITPCKVCDSEHKAFIESEILKGESCYVIAKDLESKGAIISHACINRHKKSHMKAHEVKIKKLSASQSNTKYNRNDYSKINPIERLNEVLKNKNDVNKFRQINDYVNKILINQITIVIRLQEKYLTGECKYPYEEIRGLHIVNDILVKFESFIQSLPNTLPLDDVEKSLYGRVKDINRCMVTGKISIENANKLLAGLSTSAKIFETDELAKRIKSLEEKMS